MFYNVVFFISPTAEVAGTKVSLLSPGKYLFDVPPGITIQALHDAVPPIDQSAEVAALTAQVAQLTAALAACQAAGGTQMPTISGMTVTPANLPAGGGSVVVDATVTDAVSIELDGVLVTLPTTVPVAADHTFTLVANGASAQAQASVTVAPAAPKPTISNMTATPANLPVGGGNVVVDATVVGATSLTLAVDGVDKGPVTLPATVSL